MKRFSLFVALLFMPLVTYASEGVESLNLSGSWVGGSLLFRLALLRVLR